MRALIAILALLCSVAGCKWLLEHDEPTCPPSDPKCGCTDPVHHLDCPGDPLPVSDPNLGPPIPMPWDYGAKRDVGADGDAK